MASQASRRERMLFLNYAEALLAGQTSCYQIRNVEENCEKYQIAVTPKNGVYKGHTYILLLQTKYGTDGDHYPRDPPYLRFGTQCYHVNIEPKGSIICVDMLKDKKAWSALNSFDIIMQNILIYFDQPNNSSAWNKEASKIWVDCENKYISTKEDYRKKNLKLTVEDEDKLYEDCFDPFIQEATRAMQANNMSEFAGTFPFLNKKCAEYKSRCIEDQNKVIRVITDYFETKKNKDIPKNLLANVRLAVQNANPFLSDEEIDGLEIVQKATTWLANYSTTSHLTSTSAEHTAVDTTIDQNIPESNEPPVEEKEAKPLDSKPTTQKKKRWEKYQKS